MLACTCPLLMIACQRKPAVKCFPHSHAYLPIASNLRMPVYAQVPPYLFQTPCAFCNLYLPACLHGHVHLFFCLRMRFQSVPAQSCLLYLMEITACLAIPDREYLLPCACLPPCCCCLQALASLPACMHLFARFFVSASAYLLSCLCSCAVLRLQA
jgi:hypothetical protein